MSSNRRDFLLRGAAGAGLLAAAGRGAAAQDAVRSEAAPAHGARFEISLAQWSLHKSLFAKELDNLDFAAYAAEQFGIRGVEYVNTFFKDKARDTSYLDEMNARTAEHGVKSLLIMCDGEGQLGNPDAAARTQAVENHHKWVEAAKHLGCHAIRVNAASKGSFEEQQKLAADGLHRLCEYGERFGISVIVENHGGLSSNGEWLAGTIRMADHPRCGTLPDFGNFRLGGGEEYDRYKGMAELMPLAKAVSAKSHEFDEDGNEIHTDFFRVMKIVADAGYRGFVGIEYEGGKVSEYQGILLTKNLLERTFRALD